MIDHAALEIKQEIKQEVNQEFGQVVVPGAATWYYSYPQHFHPRPLAARTCCDETSSINTVRFKIQPHSSSQQFSSSSVNGC